MDPFASPDHFDPVLQSFLEEASRLLCEWFSNSGKAGPLPTSFAAPRVGVDIEGASSKDLIEDLRSVMEGCYKPSHPGALAHLDPPPLTASIAADLVCSGLNNNLLAQELSPSLSRLENDLCQWFADRLNLPETAGGVAASGGTLSNLMALVVARKISGLQNDPNAIVIASSDAHVSLKKAINVMGLSPDSLQQIPTNKKGQIPTENLRKLLLSLRSTGRKCFAVVATAGTTVRGAVDPITQLADVCNEEKVWLHVDGAIGGVYGLSKSTSSIINGISLANSITLNPQKVLGIAKTSSILLVRNKLHLKKTFETGLPYIDPPNNDEIHCGEMGLQGTRSAEVLKLWLGIRQLGEKGIEDLLNISIQKRIYLQERIDLNLFNVITGPLHLLSFTPKESLGINSCQWSKSTKEFLLGKDFMLSRPFHDDLYYLKAVLGNPHTQYSHLDQLAKLVNQSLKNK